MEYPFKHDRGKRVISHLFTQKCRSKYNMRSGNHYHVNYIGYHGIKSCKTKQNHAWHGIIYRKYTRNIPNVYNVAIRPEIQVKRREPL